MATLIEEIQLMCINNDTDIVSLLRKSYLAANKLQIIDFATWIRNELNGYPDKSLVPEYRVLTGNVKYFNRFHGWIPVYFENAEMEDIFGTYYSCESIPQILDYIKQDKEEVSFSYNSVATDLFLKQGIMGQVNLKISTSSFINLVEHVKTAILDWTIILEKTGIKGDGISFSDEEVKIAKSKDEIICFIEKNVASGSEIRELYVSEREEDGLNT